MEILTNSERETEAAGAAFSAKLPDGTVVAMYGELGAGKTACQAAAFTAGAVSAAGKKGKNLAQTALFPRLLPWCGVLSTVPVRQWNL